MNQQSTELQQQRQQTQGQMSETIPPPTDTETTTGSHHSAGDYDDEDHAISSSSNNKSSNSIKKILATPTKIFGIQAKERRTHMSPRYGAETNPALLGSPSSMFASDPAQFVWGNIQEVKKQPPPKRPPVCTTSTATKTTTMTMQHTCDKPPRIDPVFFVAVKQEQQPPQASTIPSNTGERITTTKQSPVHNEDEDQEDAPAAAAEDGDDENESVKTKLASNQTKTLQLDRDDRREYDEPKSERIRINSIGIKREDEKSQKQRKSDIPQHEKEDETRGKKACGSQESAEGPTIESSSPPNEVQEVHNNKLPSFVDKRTLSLVQDYLEKFYLGNTNGGADGGPTTAATTTTTTTNDDVCDDDEIVAFMVRMNRYAEQQTNSVIHNRIAQKALLKQQKQQATVKDHSSFSDEEDEDDDDQDTLRLLEEFVAWEEKLTLGRELFHRMIQTIQKQHDELATGGRGTTTAASRNQRKKNSRRKHHNRVLEKRTLGWLRKSVGLDTGSNVAAVVAASHHHPAIKSIVQVQCQGRRFTRGMARQHHDSKKQQQKKRKQTNTEDESAGLEALKLALNDLEAERGGEPFVWPLPPPLPKMKKAKLTSKLLLEEDHHHDQQQNPPTTYVTLANPHASTRTKRSHPSSTSIEDSNIDSSPKATIVTKTTSVDDKQSNQKYKLNKDGDNSIAKGENKKTATGDHRKKGNNEKTVERNPLLSKISSSGSLPPLRLEDWKLRNKNRRANDEVYDPCISREPIALPKPYLDRGLVRRSPDWTTINPRTSGKQRTKPPTLQQQPSSSPLLPNQPASSPSSIRRREIHAHYCAMMMKHLSGKPRSRARYEFFYGDLDRAWYNRNDFIREAAKLGVPPGSQLTSREWKVVRRLVNRGKPRRFSKAFLDEQRRDRNRYRRIVREAQTGNSNNLASLVADLDWDEPIPARIPVGSIVTAYNHQYHILQRGVVLSYETARNKYFIRFPAGYANLFCPDYEVARHGLPEFIVPGRTAVLGDATRESAGGGQHWDRLSSANSIARGTSRRDLELSNGSWGRKDLARSASKEKSSNSSLVDSVAEREMVALVLGTVEDALERKTKILACLDEFGHPSNEDNRYHHQDVAWLIANLDSTNVVLERGAHYMRCLYGPCYLSHESKRFPPQTPSKQEMMAWLLSARCDDTSAALVSGQSDETGADSKATGTPVIPPSMADLNEWSKMLLLDSEDICRQFLAGQGALARDDNPTFTIDRVSSVGTLLLASSFIQENIASFVDVYGLQGMYYVHAQMLDRIAAEANSDAQLSGYEALDHYGQVVAIQNGALDELKEAVDALNAEITASMLQDCMV